jgi:dTDP-4-dehydrorhamnose reductase
MAADILVLGAGGMFGHMAAAVLGRRFKMITTDRAGEAGSIPFDVLQPDEDLTALARGLDPDAIILNAVAVTASQIGQAADDATRERALLVNSVFPHRLARIAAGLGHRVIHISTDAVFPPHCGPVTEDAALGPQDVYGMTKAAGEIEGHHCVTIRCSIVGPPAARRRSGLWGWISDQAPGATISGYVNQLWSGITTRQLAETCAALVDPGRFSQVRAAGPIHHLAPNPVLSKFDLVKYLAALLRSDLYVAPAQAPRPVSRLLSSRHHRLEALAPRWSDWPETLAAAARP